MTCVALVHSGKHEEVWTHCQNQRQKGSRFCKFHSDAVSGAILGLISQQPGDDLEPAIVHSLMRETRKQSDA